MRALGCFASIVICLLGIPSLESGAASAFAESAATIKLGGIFSLSGFGAKGGVGEMRAAQLAVDQLNAQGGVEGYPIQFIVEDNQSELKASAAAFNKLVHVDNIDALVGPNWSEFFAVVGPLAEREKVPMISPSGVMALTGQRRYVFTLMQPPIATNRPLAELALAHTGVKEVVGIVHENVYLENAWNASKQIWGDRLAISEVRVNSGESPDYRSILLRFAHRKDVAIYAALLPGQYHSLLKARKQLGIDAPVYGVDILYDEAVPADAELLRNVWGTDFITLGSEKFHTDFVGRYGEKPLNYAAKAYDAVRLLAEGFVACGRRSYRCIETANMQGESGHIRFGADHVVAVDGPVADTYQFIAGAWTKVK